MNPPMDMFTFLHQLVMLSVCYVVVCMFLMPPVTFLSAGLEGENILFKELLHNFKGHKELLLAPQGFETAKSKLLKVTC